MNIPRPLIFFLLFLVGVHYVSEKVDSTEAGQSLVSGVVNGDTVRLVNGNIVRLVQVDAPKLSDCYGKESRDGLRKLLPTKSTIKMEHDSVTDHERDGMNLTYIFRSAQNVNLTLVRNGLAVPYFAHGHEGDYYDSLNMNMALARKEKAGMWAKCRVTYRDGQPVQTFPR